VELNGKQPHQGGVRGGKLPNSSGGSLDFCEAGRKNQKGLAGKGIRGGEGTKIQRISKTRGKGRTRLGHLRGTLGRAVRGDDWEKTSSSLVSNPLTSWEVPEWGSKKTNNGESVGERLKRGMWLKEKSRSRRPEHNVPVS